MAKNGRKREKKVILSQAVLTKSKLFKVEFEP